MRRLYTVLGVLLLSAYALAEYSGWAMAPGVRRGVVPSSDRTAAGSRAYRFWNGGK